MKKALMLGIFSLTAVLNAQTKVVAHRGYWDTPNNAQNSIQALKMSNEIKAYGSEFDVYITADGVLVVNHDAEIQGVNIENNLYSAIEKLKLKNGEPIPTVEHYLTEGKKYPQLKMIYELKPHRNKENENRAVLATLELVKRLGVEDQVEYISFSKNICEQLIKHNPKGHVSYLKGDLTPAEIKQLGFTGIDYHFSLFVKNPTWIEEAQNLGLTVNSWTVNKEKDMQMLLDQKIDYITTDKPEVLQKLIH
ncbi:glycerophosphodiester phosphodiesterase family protein [Vaginella massiliensis]|uniref:glycerophosphodiester phosphodiesterase family protein n=1 Tax=Vaginella massiliensis TaxID=1816680 RepID=UPI0008396254|nr:glycerophosphodiester phosphodiesterase family protein [Vaginella massiliensis]